jgi:hypothetical protein
MIPLKYLMNWRGGIYGIGDNHRRGEGSIPPVQKRETVAKRALT